MRSIVFFDVPAPFLLIGSVIFVLVLGVSVGRLMGFCVCSMVSRYDYAHDDDGVCSHYAQRKALACLMADFRALFRLSWYDDRHLRARFIRLEILAVVFPAALFVVYGARFVWGVYVLLMALLVVAASVDRETFTIPNSIIVVGIVTWLIVLLVAALGNMSFSAFAPLEFPAPLASFAVNASLSRPPVSAAVGLGSLFSFAEEAAWLAIALDGLIAGIGIGGSLLLFCGLFTVVTGRASLGGGDIKLLFVVSLFLGTKLSVLNLVLTCFCGVFIALVQMLREARGMGKECKEPDRSGVAAQGTVFAFGPAIGLATFTTLVAGSSLLASYGALL